MAKEVSKETMEFIRQMKAADTAKAARPAAPKPKPAPAPLPIDKVWDSLDESQRTHKAVFHDAPPPVPVKSNRAKRRAQIIEAMKKGTYVSPSKWVAALLASPIGFGCFGIHWIYMRNRARLFTYKVAWAFILAILVILFFTVALTDPNRSDAVMLSIRFMGGSLLLLLLVVNFLPIIEAIGLMIMDEKEWAIRYGQDVELAASNEVDL